MVSAASKVEFFELFFHGSLIETVVGVFFYHNLISVRLQTFNEFHRRAVLEERILLAKEGEFRMIFLDGSDGGDLSVGLAEAVQ